MPKFKLSMVKNHRKKSGSSKDRFLSNGNNFVGIQFFSSSNFHNLNKKGKKQYIKNILRTKTRSDLSSKYRINKKERLIVNQCGYYGLDKTLFDEKVKIPKKLRDRKVKNNG